MGAHELPELALGACDVKEVGRGVDDGLGAADGLERLGGQAAVIGHVTADPPGIVQLKTAFGGTRIVDLLVGDPLPRIC